MAGRDGGREGPVYHPRIRALRTLAVAAWAWAILLQVLDVSHHPLHVDAAESTRSHNRYSSSPTVNRRHVPSRTRPSYVYNEESRAEPQHRIGDRKREVKTGGETSASRATGRGSESERHHADHARDKLSASPLSRKSSTVSEEDDNDGELPSWRTEEEDVSAQAPGALTKYLTRRWRGAVHKASKVMREAKAYVSFADTQTLLKATRPNNDAAKERWVVRLLASLHALPLPVPDASPAELRKAQRPYRRVLEGLWARMAERDWRTVTKSIYILHRMAREASPAHAGGFRALLPMMQKEICRATGSSYFSLSELTQLSPAGQHLGPFLEQYGLFVYTRFLVFEKDYSELASLDPEHDLAAFNLMMEKVATLSSYALSLYREVKPTLSEVTAPCLELALRDITDLWLIMLQALQRSVRARFKEGGKQPKRLDCTIRQCRWVLDSAPQMLAFFEEAAKALHRFNMVVDIEPFEDLNLGPLDEWEKCLQWMEQKRLTTT